MKECCSLRSLLLGPCKCPPFLPPLLFRPHLFIFCVPLCFSSSVLLVCHSIFLSCHCYCLCLSVSASCYWLFGFGLLSIWLSDCQYFGLLLSWSWVVDRRTDLTPLHSCTVASFSQPCHAHLTTSQRIRVGSSVPQNRLAFDMGNVEVDRLVSR